MSAANDNNERWLPVVGYEDCYEVSSIGRVRSLPREVSYGGKRPGVSRLVRGQLLKPGLNDSGYPVVNIGKNSMSRPERVHRMVAMAFLGPPPSPQHEVAHGDGDRTNANLSNLRWATRAENMADAVAHGTTNRGARSPMAKLTDGRVQEIRRLVADGQKHLDVARQFGVSRSVVGRIANRNGWRHVQ